MPIVPSKEIVEDAFRRGYAIPAINTQGGNYEIVRACIEGAHEMHSPIIVQVYPTNTEYYGLDWLVVTATALAKRYNIPIAIHLDHGKSEKIVYDAIKAGFTSVMLDYSHESLHENIAAINRLLPIARKKGISVEAELGSVNRAGEELSNKATPMDVTTFLSEAHVDMLAVGIGNAHGHYVGDPDIDISLLAEIKKVSKDTPLVLHGTSGIPPTVIKECIQLGMAKVNVGTFIREQCLAYYKEILNSDGDTHLWKRMDRINTLLKEDIRNLILTFGSDGKV